MELIIRESFIIEAEEYARKSRVYTSDAHDFHSGGVDDKERKMLEGKLGEKVFKEFLISKGIGFLEDSSSHKEADDYDFLINDLKIDVKTRTQTFHIRTLEMVHQLSKRPKDIYISVKLSSNKKSGTIIGWCYREDFLNSTVENNGYTDNYVIYDKELRPIPELIRVLKFNQYWI